MDNSNVAPGEVLVLPADPDAVAEELRQRLSEAAGGPVGVMISDTAGRAWRMGQTDLAIGAAGVVVLDDYNGRDDPYGNELRVTARAVADELAAAADLVKEKVAGRPIAVHPRPGGSWYAADTAGGGAATLIRPVDEDMFAHGTREAVLAAVLAATGRGRRVRAIVALEGEELLAAVSTGAGRTGPRRSWSAPSWRPRNTGRAEDPRDRIRGLVRCPAGTAPTGQIEGVTGLGQREAAETDGGEDDDTETDS